MRNLHRISGIVISVFISLHLINHLVSVFGVNLHIETMNSLRKIYRNPTIETVLMICISFQIFSGIRLIYLSHIKKQSFFEKLQKWSGMYMAFFLLIHLSAIFTGRYLFNINTNFYFGVAGLNSFPMNMFFIPYYSLAIISFFAHIASVHHKKIKYHLLGLAPSQQSKLILLAGIIFCILILLGATNGFSGLKVPDEYQFKIS